MKIVLQENSPTRKSIPHYSGPSEGVPVLFGRHNLPPLVEIGLTDLPKPGGAMAHTPGTTGLLLNMFLIIRVF